MAKFKNNKNNKKSRLPLVMSFLRGSLGFFFIGVIFTLIMAVIDAVIPQVIRIALDNVISSKPLDLSPVFISIINLFGGIENLKRNIWIVGVVILILALLKVLCEYLIEVFSAKGAETLSETTRNRMFSHLAHLPYSWYKKNRAGDIIQRATSDVSTMNDFLSSGLTYFIRIIAMFILSVVFMAKMNGYLCLIALSVFPIIIINSIYFDKKVERAFENYDEEESKVSSIIQENLTGVRVVRAFGRQKQEYDKFEKENKKFTELGMAAGKTYSWFSGISKVLLVIQGMLVIIFGAIFCVKGTMTTGEYIAFIAYNALLAWPLNELGVTITDLGKTSISIGRIAEIMEVKEETDGKNSLTPPLNGDIKFENVSFSYVQDAPVLKDVSFTIESGKTLGILGGTGSGKTTLMMLLDKIYPLSSGKITINGVDINDIDREYLRKNIGMVLQDPYLFSRTIYENISITDEKISRKKVEEAVNSAQLKETIEGFPKGYETFVGERGVTLSGGQKQRVAIARILTRNTPIIVFDDSLSAVDTETDAKIRRQIEKKFGSATIILISHRISTLSKADKIIVMEDGKITEEGNHKQLIEREGIYKKIYEIQQGDSHEEK